MRLPHRLQGQKSRSRGGAYCGGHLAAQLAFSARWPAMTGTMRLLWQPALVLYIIILICSLSTNDILKQLQITYNYLSITYISY